MAVLWLYRLLVPFAVLYMLLHPNCLKYRFQNKTRRKRHLTNFSPRKVRNLYSFNFLSMSCPDWVVQMVLTNSRVPECQNNIPRFNIFFLLWSTYSYCTVKVEVCFHYKPHLQLPSTTFPQNKPFPVSHHISCRVKYCYGG